MTLITPLRQMSVLCLVAFLPTAVVPPVAAAQASTRPLSVPTEQTAEATPRRADPQGADSDADQSADHLTSVMLRTYHTRQLKPDTLIATLRKLGLAARIEKRASDGIIVQASAAEHTAIAALITALTEPTEPTAPTEPTEPTASRGHIQPVGGRTQHSDAMAARLRDALGTTQPPIPSVRPFKFYPDTATAQEKWLHDVLERPCPELDFPGETPLTEVLDHIAEFASSEYPDAAGRKRTLYFLPDAAELLQEGVERLDDVVVTDIRITEATIESALNLIFEQTTEPQLELIIHNESALVTTHWQINNHRYLQTRIHDVGDLLRRRFYEVDRGNLAPVGGSGGGSSGFYSLTPQLLGESPSEDSPTDTIHPLCALITEMTYPPYVWQHTDGDGGSLRLVGDALVIRQGHACQREIVRLLNRLSVSAKTPHSDITVYQPYGPDAPPRERWLHSLMDAPCPELDFPGETPLSEVLEKLAAPVNKQHQANGGAERLRFIPDIMELEGINSLEDVQIRDVQLNGERLDSALRLIFGQTCEPALTWVIENETLLVTTETKASELMRMRTYPVGPVQRRMFGNNPCLLIDVIQNMTSPPALWTEIDGEGGGISVAGDCLVIMQTPHVHQQIVRLLNQLNAVAP